MTKEDCRANALKCYRIAQKAADRDVRGSLLDLAVQWPTSQRRSSGCNGKMRRSRPCPADVRRCIEPAGERLSDRDSKRSEVEFVVHANAEQVLGQTDAYRDCRTVRVHAIRARRDQARVGRAIHAAVAEIDKEIIRPWPSNYRRRPTRYRRRQSSRTGCGTS